MKSTIFKAITVVLAIFGAGASIVLGFVMPTFSYNPITEDFTTSNFNFGLMFSCLIGVAILCSLFAGITCILVYLEEIKEKIEQPKVDNSANDIKSLNINDLEPLFKDETKEQKVDLNSWKCPNCGRMNQNYVKTCGCGKIKS